MYVYMCVCAGRKQDGDLAVYTRQWWMVDPPMNAVQCSAEFLDAQAKSTEGRKITVIRVIFVAQLHNYSSAVLLLMC